MYLNTFNLQTKEDVKTIKINDMDVNVKQYLPSEEKNNLLQIAIQSAETSTILNAFALEIIFYTYLVIKYTDIQFNEDDLSDIFALYDKLETNGVIDEVLAAIPSKEDQILKDYLEDMVPTYDNYNCSISAVADRFINFFSSIGDELKNLNPEALKELANSITPKAE